MTRPTTPGRTVTLVRRGERPACVMLPGAGGGLNPYLRLAAQLGETHDVYVVRAAGLVPGEEPEPSVDAMAASALEALDASAIVPSLVFGWSMGGAVGWELCTRLADRGELPPLVLVDASPLPRQATAAEDAGLREIVLGMLGDRPAAATVALVRRVLDAQILALTHYRARRSYAGPVLMLMCSGRDLPARTAAAGRWRELAPALRAGRLSADHYGVFDPERLPELVGAIAPFVDATRGARC